MTLIHVITLALLQGLTEFLPISSSAHLLLVPVLTDWPDQGLAFDVAVHVGTLAAVVFYFRRDLLVMVRDWGRSIGSGRRVGDSNLAWGVLWGTVPVGLAGLAFQDVIEHALREPRTATAVIAATTIGFGLLLGWADRRGRQARDEHSLTWRDVLVIGLAQALALVPGTSRSGITITAGLMVGLTREAAARFSFLLSIPAILLPGALKTYELAQAGNPARWSEVLLGAGIAGLSAYLCIHFFLRLIQRIGMRPFVVYRLALGGVLLLALAAL